MTSAVITDSRHPYTVALAAIIWRESLRFIHQRTRFIAALVRPLIWLLVFAAGFRSILGVSITPPYETYITYETYIVPGLIAMIQLFNGMQSSLALVYDREMGSMRLLLTSPLPRSYLLLAKLTAGTMISIFQVYAFLLIAELTVIDIPAAGWFALAPALIVSGLMLGAIGLALSATIRQLENFAGIMNFVIFPMFFLSSALYPLWRMRESSEFIFWICTANPFTYAVELLRHALYLKLDTQALIITTSCLVLIFTFAAWRYNAPQIASRQKTRGISKKN
ncbi:MAG: ABC transporter permease [Acidiferrobacteraceae bacterium]|nr:ABC transporter permease [Acidiferrobacteraceae bacterium]MBT3640470.1 ABC transporter permease [Acidiferrobacteraceae bacterium]MBT3769028.1 ABC transporter permease [Acidiferrobacteraceae bacterium]MBT4395278.1 ABC transporter permease [Acidiferrobacteraceae bacterium]MBT4405645.1 ABC transporter permease [Acidiferrobacteraceae bacterium]